MNDPAQALRELEPEHEFFVGIDSDGSALDTMEIKQKECFVPNTILHWDLQAVAPYAREAVEFVNLYSKWRGMNRFPALALVFDLLREREEIKQRNAAIPDAHALKEWIEREAKPSNLTLKAEVAQTGDPVLARALAWSEAVNRKVRELIHGVPPFPLVRESLEKLSRQADCVVVSATPCAALVREWKEHGLDRYVRAIAGQETGTKQEHLALAAGGKYGPRKTLMVGDALGDLEAARSNGALFYPIVPGDEPASWERFLGEAADRFFAGAYAGAYEAQLIEHFMNSLPETPPWNHGTV